MRHPKKIRGEDRSVILKRAVNSMWRIFTELEHIGVCPKKFTADFLKDYENYESFLRDKNAPHGIQKLLLKEHLRKRESGKELKSILSKGSQSPLK